MSKDKKELKTSKKMPPVTRNSRGLRDALFDELDRLRNGETDPLSANAVARLAAQICVTVQLEIDAQRTGTLLKNGGKSFALPKPIELGGNGEA